MLADDPATLYVSAPVSYLMFHGAYDTPKFRFCSPHRRPPPMGGFHLMPYPCKQGMKPTLSLLKSHSAFALHSCPLLLSPRHNQITQPNHADPLRTSPAQCMNETNAYPMGGKSRAMDLPSGASDAPPPSAVVRLRHCNGISIFAFTASRVAFTASIQILPS